MSSRRLLLLLAVAAAFGALVLSIAVGRGARAAEVNGPLNFVVIMSDDQDMDSLPVMRHLLSYIGGGWVNFTNAFANDAKCCPSRATFLTGQYSHNHGVTANGRGKYLDDLATLPVWLDDAGYHTGLIGKYLIGFPWENPASYQPPGWDVFISNHKPVDDQTAVALKFLDDAPADSPFFLYLAYTAPHHIAKPPARYKDLDVYIPPRRPNFNEADVSDKPLFVRRMPLLTEAELAEWDAERANSQRELMAVDDGVQAIMQKLQETGELDNTVVIYLADQGFSWGAHRWLYKNCPYRECSNFPLFIRMPGGGPNRVEARLVSNVDIAPTIIELASGATIKGRVPDGRSLVPLLTEPEKPWAEGVLLERHHGDPPSRFFGVQTPGYMYAEYQNGDAELYDMAADPYQMDNVVDDPAYAAVRAEMAALLQSLLAGVPLPAPAATATRPPSPADPTETATQTAAPTETATSTTTAPTVSAPTLSATPPSPTATATGTPPSPTATTTGAPPTATTEPTPTATLPAFTPTAFHFLPVQLRAGE